MYYVIYTSMLCITMVKKFNWFAYLLKKYSDIYLSYKKISLEFHKIFIDNNASLKVQSQETDLLKEHQISHWGFDLRDRVKSQNRHHKLNPKKFLC